MQASEADGLPEQAFEQCHIPSLLVTLAQLTGRMDLLNDRWRPRYIPYTDQHGGGLSPGEIAEVAVAVRELLPTVAGRAASEFPPPSEASLRKMMDFVAGTAIPERYVALLEEELGLGSVAERAETKSTSATPKSRSVLVIGAGMSGLTAGVRLKQAGYRFTIIERNDDIGGTWFANTYPGCRVDSQNHLYSLSFFPNYGWPHRYSTQPALHAYFRKLADRYDLWPHIELSTQVRSARYDEERMIWRVRLQRGGEPEHEIAVDAIVSAVGQLNRPFIPEIPGQQSFGGPQFHSATWRDDVDLRDKRVAVVGTGASAFQLIPEVAKVARKLSVFQRTAPWISPTPDYHREVGEGQRWLFENLAFYANWYRFWLFWTMTEGAMPALKLDPAWNAGDGSLSASNQRIRNALIDNIRRQLHDRPDLIDKVVPKSPFGGKRTLRDDGRWFDTLKRDNVELITEAIRELTSDAIVTKDGATHPADVIIYGTGFHASRFLEPTEIIGRDGRELTKLWAGDPRAYLGITVPGFPNFFMIYGPNTNLVAQGSIVFFSECSMRYIMGCLDLLERQGAAAMEPRAEVHDAYNLRVDEENRKMAWGLPGITNWYKSASGRVSQNWPFPLLEYWQLTQAPTPDDFAFSGRADELKRPDRSQACDTNFTSRYADNPS
jgi:4-hydroxyacetophenone monooxygenase